MKTKLTKKQREVLASIENETASSITIAMTHDLEKLGCIALDQFGDGRYEKVRLTEAGRELLKKGKGE